ncbi:MAG: FKBP-type peptidyl-prolyl cis-trans isomerase [Lacibacter sp.]
MRIIISALVFLLLCNISFAQPKKAPVKKTTTTKQPTKQTTSAPKPLLKNGIDSISYAIGMNVGSNMNAQGIDQINYIAFNKGMSDGLKNNPTPLMDINTCNMTIQQKLQEFMAKKIAPVKEEGKKYLAENKKQPGVVELPSGIQYKIISQGTGLKPTLEDTIKVHYKGTTIDGNIFDDSYSRGEPIEFPLGNLIEGWKQTLVLMPAGSKWQLFIPSDFAYGDMGSGSIQGGSTLIFELELLEVKQVKK